MAPKKNQPIFKFSQKGPRDQTQVSQLAGAMLLQNFPKIRIVKFVSSRRLLVFRAETAWGCMWRLGSSSTKIGDAFTADHKVLSEENESRLQHRDAVVVQDLRSSWIQCYHTKNKPAQEPTNSLQTFSPPDHKPGIIHADSSLEFILACDDLCWNHDKSTPYRSEANGIAEHAVRRERRDLNAVRSGRPLNIDGQNSQRPPQGCLWVDGRLTKTRKSHRDQKRSGQKCGRPCPHVLTRKQGSNWNFENPK